MILKIVSTKRELGVILPLTALVIALVLVPIASLLIGIGLLSSDQTKLQLVANAASLAALEDWSRSDPASGVVARMQSAKNRAEGIVRANSMVSFDLRGARLNEPGNSVVPTDQLIGDIRFGTLIEQNPCPASSPTSSPSCSTGCGSSSSNYPCFILRDASSQVQAELINSVQVRLRTPVLNKAAVFFSNQFSPLASTIAARATASSFSRCVALLLDVSLSSIEETHKQPNYKYGFFPVYDPSSPSDFNPGMSPLPSEYPGLFILDPPNAALFAFRENLIATPDCNRLPDATSFEDDRVIWCNTRLTRGSNQSPWNRTYNYTGANGPTSVNMQIPNNNDPTYHFRSDYQLGTTVENPSRGKLWVDTNGVDGPQPLSAFLDGFNSAVRVLLQQNSGQDRVTVKAFVGSEIPPFGDLIQGPNLTSKLITNLNYLLKATNIDNRARIGLNYLDHGWVPLGVSDSDTSIQNAGYTNIISIVDRAIQQLNDTAQCPIGSQKHIVLATDGLMTCKATDFPAGAVAVEERESDCGPSIEIYEAAEAQLLGSTPEFQGSTGKRSILQRLRESDISLSVMLAGSRVEPNFVNIKRNQENPSQPCPPEQGVSSSCYLSYQEALSRGYHNSFPSPFFDGRASCPGRDVCPDAEAYENLKLPGYKFRRPNVVFGHMAMMTGGVFCPLQPNLDITEYGCSEESSTQGIKRLCDQRRPINERQTVSPNGLNLSQQAANCMFDAIGYSPFWVSESLCRWDGSKCLGPYTD